MKELLREKGFWAAVLVILAGISAGLPLLNIGIPMASGSFINFFVTALSSQVMLFLIPIAAVLPMGGIYIRESSFGFLKFYITKISRMEYIKRKSFQIYAGGFLIFFIAGILELLFCFLFIYPLELQGSIDWESIQTALEQLLRVSMIGGILSGSSGIFAAIFQNYYMAYGLPFVCYYMLMILKERYLSELYVLYPPEWITCEQDWGAYGIWLFLLICSAAVILLNSLILNYRLREV